MRGTGLLSHGARMRAESPPSSARLGELRIVVSTEGKLSELS